MTKKQNIILMSLIAEILNADTFYGKEDFGTRGIPMWWELSWTPEQIAEAVKVYAIFRCENPTIIEEQLKRISGVNLTSTRVYGNLVMLQTLASTVFEKMTSPIQES